MRRGTLPLSLFLIVFAVGVASVGFWPTTNAQARRVQPALHAKGQYAATTPHLCTQPQIIHSLLKPGTLEIWNTGSTGVPTNSLLDPHQYPATIPYGKPLFTGLDLDPNSLSTGRDEQTGYYFINFSMKTASATRLIHFTANNIGKHITITLNRIVVSSPTITYTLPGRGQFQMSPRSFALLGIKCTI